MSHRSYSTTVKEGYGFYKDTAYIFIAGDWYYYNSHAFNGKLKDMKFFYNDILT